MKAQRYLAVFLISGIILSLYATSVLADGRSAEEALPTENVLDAPPPPLLQAERLIEAPRQEAQGVEETLEEALSAEEEIALPVEDDLWPVISKGMILIKSEPDGEIVASEDPKELLGVRDIIYLHSDHAPFSSQEELIIYRINRPVFHPANKSFLGDLIQVLGVARVKAVGEDVATAEIILSKTSISRLDKVASIDRFILLPEAQAAIPEEGLEAMIVDATESHVSLAQHDIVYIDHGQHEGIVPGDQFIVIHGGERQGAFSASDEHQAGLRLPYREIGTMIVLSTQEHTATAKITNSLESISIGDKVLYVNE